MAKSKRPTNIIEFDLAKAKKPIHEQYLDLAKKGFKDPNALTPDEIWQLCRAFIFYSAQLNSLS